MDLGDGLVGVGWRHGPEYEVQGGAAYVAVAGLFAAGLGCVALGALGRRMPKVIAAAAMAGLLVWFAVLVYATATQ
jgi:hypothetical protein